MGSLKRTFPEEDPQESGKSKARRNSSNSYKERRNKEESS
jgi:hypothetical protein